MGRHTKTDKPIPHPTSWLTVLWQVEMLELGGRRYGQWLCQCKCGKTRKVPRMKIINGGIRSCGCMKKALMKEFAEVAAKVWAERRIQQEAANVQ